MSLGLNGAAGLDGRLADSAAGVTAGAGLVSRVAGGLTARREGLATVAATSRPPSAADDPRRFVGALPAFGEP